MMLVLKVIFAILKINIKSKLSASADPTKVVQQSLLQQCSN